jgi:hypothetical protein
MASANLVLVEVTRHSTDRVLAITATGILTVWKVRALAQIVTHPVSTTLIISRAFLSEKATIQQAMENKVVNKVAILTPPALPRALCVPKAHTKAQVDKPRADHVLTRTVDITTTTLVQQLVNTVPLLLIILW